MKSLPPQVDSADGLIAFHEEVYTSAPQLLEGGTDLGIVTRSRGFPMRLESYFRGIRGYTIVAGLSLDQPDLHPPRLVVGTYDSWFTVSQIVYRGADHTGRTTPLAHHVAFPSDVLKSRGVSPAAALRTVLDLLRSDWKEEPTWIEPPRSSNIIEYPAQSASFPAELWTRIGDAHAAALLSEIIDGLLAFPHTKKMIVVCLSPSFAKQAGILLADVLACLPESHQFQTVCASHILETSDLVADAALCMTYPGTPFLNSCRGRRDERAPIIIDLSAGPPKQNSQLGPYATLLKKQLTSENVAQRISLLTRLYEELGINCTEDSSKFVRAVDVRERLLGIRRFVDLGDAAQLIEELTSLLPSASSCVEQWCMQIIAKALRKPSAVDKWPVLAGIGADRRWPNRVRETALREILQHDDEAFSALLERPRQTEPLRSLLRTFQNEKPDFVPGWIRRLGNSGTDAERERAGAIIKLALTIVGREPNPYLLKWGRAICALETPAKQDVLDGLAAHLRHNLRDARQLEAFHISVTRACQMDDVFVQLFYVPFLRSLLEDESQFLKSSQVAWYLLDLGLRMGTERDVINWLRENTKLMTDANLREWRTIAGNDGTIEQLELALRDTGASEKRHILDRVSREIETTHSRMSETPNYTTVSRFSLWLAVSVILLQIYNSLHWFGPPINGIALRTEPNLIPFRILHLICFTALGCWIGAEIGLRCIRRITPATRAVVPIVRYTIALGLLAAVTTSLLRLISPFVFVLMG